MQKYSVNHYLINNLLNDIQLGQIAIPEIQRPFVWSTVKVRNLMDSLYKGFPIGYIIAWKNPDVRLKDGTISRWKKVLIDWQQRITALKAAVLGDSIVDKDYRKVKIKIAFHPTKEEFQTWTPAIGNDKEWIEDISVVMSTDTSLLTFVSEYCDKNPELDRKLLETNITKLVDIKNKQVWFIELSENLDIDTVTEIFIRINSEWVRLSEADFAMSKIASHSDFGVNLRKFIDYFCHLSREPKFFETLKEVDHEFVATDYFKAISWLKDENDDLYDPDYSDVVRVSFTKEFERGKLSELVSLLSGRNFETRMFEQDIMDQSYQRLEKGIYEFTNETNFKRFIMIIKSAGFTISDLIRSQNVLNFAYIIYLKLRETKEDPGKIERLVARWLVMSILTGRYSWSPESTFDYDIKHISAEGVEKYLKGIEESQLSDAFWDFGLVSELDKSVISNPYLGLFFASQIKAKDRWFLSRDITVADMIIHRWDIHHLFPKEYLKKQYKSKGEYNQIANFVYAQQEINIKIGKKAPEEYMKEVWEQTEWWDMKYGSINDKAELEENMRQNCIPMWFEHMTLEDFPKFLEERRKLMAQKIKGYYFSL